MSALTIPVEQRPVVTTQAQHGLSGYVAGLANASRSQRQRWGRMGGRPRNPSWADLQIQGTTGRKSARTGALPRGGASQ